MRGLRTTHPALFEVLVATVTVLILLVTVARQASLFARGAALVFVCVGQNAVPLLCLSPM